LTRQDIVDALAGAERQAGRSDAATAARLGDVAPPVAPVAPLVAAAVLVPLVQRDEGLTVLLTQRTAHLANHAGQISFPGGSVEATDADCVAAALRETEEEIGLAPETFDILGRLDDYTTFSGFNITPVVGLARPPLAFAIDPFEVEEVFEVPLDFVLDPRNQQRHSREALPGQRRYFYAIPYGRHYIWGATAGMLVNFSEILGIRCVS
jgi:8-oxo-dGTP pyrophosphatase MutT (NUDIX family)